jgi:hypothetical protein
MLASLRKRRSARVVQAAGARRWLVAEASVCLGLAAVALVILRFRTVASHLGQSLPPAEAAARMTEVPDASGAEAIAQDVGWAVRRAADHLPFAARCLAQALAAKYMLRRRNITGALHLGVATNQGLDGTMMVHAWLDAAGVEVTGYPVMSEFTEVACFV